MPEVATVVREVRPETDRAATLRLDLGGAPFPYRPGQYVTIDPRQFGALAGAIREREARRGWPEGPACFALSSDGTDPGTLEITLKDSGTGALLAPWLLREARAGLGIAVAGPGGRYCLPEAPPPGIEGFLHVCAGSGVAPNRGMIRHALARGWPQRHLLLLQDRSEEEVLFKAEWPDLLARHPGRFRIRHAFSRAEPLGEEVARSGMEGWLDPARSIAWVCGPGASRDGRVSFLARWRGLLLALGFASESIRSEP